MFPSDSWCEMSQWGIDHEQKHKWYAVIASPQREYNNDNIDSF